MGDVIVGEDGRARCPWGLAAPDYVAYHDQEWGQPIRDDNGLFERLTLEAFQSGLSWLTILRKRENFRAAFAGFAIENRAKIDAAMHNAKAAASLDEGLAEVIWAFAQPNRPAPVGLDDVPAQTAESKALAKELKRRGFVFVGATTAYALMQAAGLVNDHLRDCWVRTAHE